MKELEDFWEELLGGCCSRGVCWLVEVANGGLKSDGYVVWEEEGVKGRVGAGGGAGAGWFVVVVEGFEKLFVVE